MRLCGISVGHLPEKPLGSCLLLHLPAHIDTSCANAVTEVLVQQYLGFHAGEVFRVDMIERTRLTVETYLSEDLPPGLCVIVNDPALYSAPDSPIPTAKLLESLTLSVARYGGPQICMVVPFSTKTGTSSATTAVLSAAAVAGFLLMEVSSQEVQEALRELQQLYVEDAVKLLSKSVIAEAELVLVAAKKGSIL